MLVLPGSRGPWTVSGTWTSGAGLSGLRTVPKPAMISDAPFSGLVGRVPIPSISIWLPLPRAAARGIIRRVRRPDSPTLIFSGIFADEPMPSMIRVLPVAEPVVRQSSPTIEATGSVGRWACRSAPTCKEQPSLSIRTLAPSALATAIAASLSPHGE